MSYSNQDTDERIEACIILRCPLQSEDVLGAYISRLKIKLEAFAVSTAVRHGAAKQRPPVGAKELVDSCFIEDTDDPVVAVGDDGDDSGSVETGDHNKPTRYVYVLWRKQLHIGMPPPPEPQRRANQLQLTTTPITARTRIRAPTSSLYLTATCTLLPSSSTPPNPISNKTYTPPTPNLFAALTHDPSFHNAPPILPASRLLKHAPTDSIPADPPRTLKNATRTHIPLVPALNTRLRCEIIGGSPDLTRMVVALDLEGARLSDGAKANADGRGACAVEVESVEVTLSEGRAEAIAPLDMPLRLRSLDCTTLLYDLQLSLLKVQRKALMQTSVVTQHVLSVRIQASVRFPTQEADGTDTSDRGPPSPDDATSVERKHPSQRHQLQTQFRTTLDLSALHARLSHQSHSHTQNLNLNIPALPTSSTSTTTTNAPPPPPKHPLTLTITTQSTGQGTATWDITVMNNTPSRPRAPALNLRLVPLMVHQAPGYVKGSDSDGAVPMIPTNSYIDILALSPGGGIGRGRVTWMTQAAALRRQRRGGEGGEGDGLYGTGKEEVGKGVLVGSIGGLRVVNLDAPSKDGRGDGFGGDEECGLYIPPCKLPDIVFRPYY